MGSSAWYRVTACCCILLARTSVASTCGRESEWEEEPLEQWTPRVPSATYASVAPLALLQIKNAPAIAQDHSESGTSQTQSDGATTARRCTAKKLKQVCAKNASYYIAKLQSAAKERDAISGLPAPWPSGEALQGKMQTLAGTLARVPDHKAAMEVFELLQSLDIRDAVAFQETWTDDDTAVLLAMDPGADGFTTGDFAVEKFRSDRLPRAEVLKELVDKGSVAVVGGGPSVAGHGFDIDSHPVVARFNNHLGAELHVSDTGKKTSIHVINVKIQEGSNDPGVICMDLESDIPGQSYCNRWHQENAPLHKSSAESIAGEADVSSSSSADGSETPMLLLRPSIFCALPELERFTRGFLFYWFIGRLFPQADVYGMSTQDLGDHYDPFQPQVLERVPLEPYLEFEHFVYAAAEALQFENRLALLRQDPMLDAWREQQNLGNQTKNRSNFADAARVNGSNLTDAARGNRSNFTDVARGNRSNFTDVARGNRSNYTDARANRSNPKP